MAILGIDLGGTQIRVGEIENNTIQDIKSTLTPTNATKEDVLEAIVNLIAQFNGIDAIGIGVPSVVDVKKGIVYDVTNIPSWDEVHLKDFLEKRFNIPVFVNNDANCFVAGEKQFGKGKDASSLVGITLGTGLGTGLIFNDKLYEGRNCGAGELCNTPYLEHNYEYYCSGQFFKDELHVSGKTLAEKAKSGDKEALAAFKTFGFHLGKFLQAILYAYDPEVIVFGGSVSQSFSLFYDEMMQSLQDNFIFPNSLKNLKIELSELDNSGIYGAASLAM